MAKNMERRRSSKGSLKSVENFLTSGGWRWFIRTRRRIITIYYPGIGREIPHSVGQYCCWHLVIERSTNIQYCSQSVECCTYGQPIGRCQFHCYQSPSAIFVSAIFVSSPTRCQRLYHQYHSVYPAFWCCTGKAHNGSCGIMGCALPAYKVPFIHHSLDHYRHENLPGFAGIPVWEFKKLGSEFEKVVSACGLTHRASADVPVSKFVPVFMPATMVMSL